MPQGNDPTATSELEAAFGVTANAQELIDYNRSRMSTEQRAIGLKPENGPLTAEVRDDLAALSDHVGQELAPENVTVRGVGSGALIQYIYVDHRDANAKGYVPFVEVYGSDKERKARSDRVAARTTPDEAAQAAADERTREAEAEAAEAVRQAQADAEDTLAKARAAAEETLADANADAEKIRADAAADAQKAADKAREDAEKAAKAKASSSAKK